MSRSDVITGSITRESKAPSRAGFGQGLVLAKNAPSDYGAAKIKSFTGDSDGVAAVKAQFGSGSEEEAWASSIVSQAFKPTFFHIGIATGAATAWVKTITFSGAVGADNEITLNVNGLEITQAYATDSDTTLTALALQIETDAPGVATASLSGSVITVTAATGWALAIDSVNVTGTAAPTGTVATSTTGRTAYDDVMDLVGLSRDWYALGSLDRSAGHLLEAARAIQASDRLFLGVSGDADIIDSTATLDVMSRLKTLGYDRASLNYHNKSAEHIDAAVLGRFFPLDPGKTSFNNKPLIGITAPSLDTTEQGAIKAKNGNYYKDIGDRYWYWPGKTANGDYIDIRRNIDYMLVNLIADVLDFMEKNEIVTYTQEGIDAVLNVIRQGLRRFNENDQIISAGFSVPGIEYSSIAQVERDNRVLPDITFEATLRGAIGSVGFIGTVGV